MFSDVTVDFQPIIDKIIGSLQLDAFLYVDNGVCKVGIDGPMSILWTKKVEILC